MKVQETINLEEGHSIEFGIATWNDEEVSVRNRYETRSGGFSPHSSSELPLRDVALLAAESMRRDLLETGAILEIIEVAVASVRRRLRASS